ncbi:hypothetical protein [Rhizobium phaseoli]|uniref:hypothetical protein n=1 Tax=Rhizobium phaseoli TaxID=396 RepID=UPI0014383D5F|nr:hypothetical protein [Rhizobium phaseoli]MDK4728739.1 hypothetical protein [Rhizobium phaseoli]NKE86821.1 hypothetical protein [Rhizobium phaseoli]
MLDDVWPISTERDNQEREKPVTLRFDAPIRGWPNAVRLNDQELEDDLITAKLLIFLSLEPEPVGWMKTASSVQPFHRRHLNFIRWRVDRGISGNRFVGPAHYRDFERRYRRAGLEGLLDVREKATRLVHAIKCGELVLAKHHRSYFFHEGVEALLGLSLNQTPPEAIEVLAAYAEEAKLRFNHTRRLPVKIPDHTKRRVVTATADLSVFYHLARLRDFLKHDPLNYDAYADEAELAQALGGWVTETVRTDDSPAYQTSFLINSSLKIILSDLPEKIIDCCVGIGLGAEPDEALHELNGRFSALGFRTVSMTYRRNRGLNSTILKTTSRELLYKVLVGACAVVIAAFSARRNGEIMSLRPGCIRRDEYDEVWLETWISKRQRFTTRIPANMSTARAVAILEQIRLRTKRFGESQWLLELFDPSGNVKFNLNVAMRFLAEWCMVPPLPDGSYWKFAAHQQRKFFAVAHQWRYFFPDLLVLNHHLRQLDRGTTIGYCKMEAGKALALHEDREMKRGAKRAFIWSAEDRVAALKEEEQSFVRQICLSALAGELKLGGVGGRTLYNDLKKIVSDQIEITSARTASRVFNDSLDAFLQSLNMQVHPEGHSVCSCGAKEQKKQAARCLELKQRLTGSSPNAEPGQDYTFADEDVCAHCPNNIRLKALLPYWERQVDEAEAALSSKSIEVRDKANERKQFLLGVLSEFDDGDQ